MICAVALKAQQTLVIEGPNDKVAPVTLQVKTDFDQEHGILQVTFTGDDTDEANTLWILNDATVYGRLNKAFSENGGKLSLSSFAKEQFEFMNLKDKTAVPLVNVTGSQLLECTVQGKSGNKAPIQRQLLSLDGRSTLVLRLQVQDDAEQVTLDLKNPLLLLGKEAKYELAFVGKDATITFDVARNYCLTPTTLLEQLRELNAMFRKGEETLNEMKTEGNNCIDNVKSLLINQLTLLDLKRYLNTKCQEVDTEYDTLCALRDRIVNFDTKLTDSGGAGGSGGSGGSGGAGAPPIDDCNFKKVNDDLKAAVVKMNSYANDWSSATDGAVKSGKKLAFESLVKETDAKVNALSPACRKKLDNTSLKNYEMAKKLIK